MKYLLLLPLVALLSCSKPSTPAPPVTIDMPEVELFYDGAHQFVLNQGSVRIQATDYTWTSSNPVTGAISDTGLFTAKRIGDTFIYGTPKTGTGDKVSARVSVKPYFTTWGKVITSFGVNRASVKVAETRSLWRDNEYGLTYYGENDIVVSVQYQFKNDQLTSATVLPKNNPETVTFLKERYDFKGKISGYYVFTDSKEVTIWLNLDDIGGIYVVYGPYTGGGRMGSQTESPFSTLNQLPRAGRPVTAQSVRKMRG